MRKKTQKLIEMGLAEPWRKQPQAGRAAALPSA